MLTVYISIRTAIQVCIFNEERKRRGLYHRYRPSICSFGSQLQIEQWCVFLSVLKIELVETTHSREEDTPLKLVHITACLLHDSWIRWLMMLFLKRERIRKDLSLR
jgi:hypothetical protein